MAEEKDQMNPRLEEIDFVPTTYSSVFPKPKSALL